MLLCLKQKTAYEMPISEWSSDVCATDLRVCDAELVDSIYYSIFPNISPGGCYNPIVYRFRPDGDNPEQCIHEIMFMLPVPKGQDRPKPASIHWLGLNDDYMEAPELGSLAKEIGRASCRERVCQYV